MEKPDQDLAYEWFKLVGDGPCPSYCDDLMDEQELADLPPDLEQEQRRLERLKGAIILSPRQLC